MVATRAPPTSPASHSRAVVRSSNVTTPGPWCLNHLMLIGRSSSPTSASRPTHAAIVSGTPARTWSAEPVMPLGPRPDGPPGSQRTRGAMLVRPGNAHPASSYDRLVSRPGTESVCPAERIVHTTSRSPKSAGTLTVKAPQCRRSRSGTGSNRVGWRPSNPAGSMKFSRPSGTSITSSVFTLKKPNDSSNVPSGLRYHPSKIGTTGPPVGRSNWTSNWVSPGLATRRSEARWATDVAGTTVVTSSTTSTRITVRDSVLIANRRRLTGPDLRFSA